MGKRSCAEQRKEKNEIKQCGIAGATARGWNVLSAVSSCLKLSSDPSGGMGRSMKDAHPHLNTKAVAGMFHLKTQELGQDF